MKSIQKTTSDFGVPNVTMPHHFNIKIPSGRFEPIEIWEDFGVERVGANVEKICRVAVDREVWRKLAKGIERYLKHRLKEKSMRVSRFVVGENRVERLLGREVCVLAWAIEDASLEEAKVAYTHWLTYRPEELWWLFQQVDKEGGKWDDLKCGWRLAIRQALTGVSDSSFTRFSTVNLKIPGL